MTLAVPRVVLDSNVIYSRVLHELFGRLASEGARIAPLWSDELLAEAQRVIRQGKPTTDEVASRWVGYLRGAFPAGRVDITTLDPAIDLSQLTDDTDDHHVCALAIVGRADMLITNDSGFGGRRDLAAPLGRHNVEVLTPDTFLARDIVEEPEMYRTIIASQAAAWTGGRPIGELLDAFDRAGAPAFVRDARQVCPT